LCSKRLNEDVTRILGAGDRIIAKASIGPVFSLIEGTRATLGVRLERYLVTRSPPVSIAFTE